MIDVHPPVAISRRGAGAVVVMSMKDDSGLIETSHLLSKPKGAARLLSTISSSDLVSVEIDGETLSKLGDEDPDGSLGDDPRCPSYLRPKPSKI